MPHFNESPTAHRQKVLICLAIHNELKTGAVPRKTDFNENRHAEQKIFCDPRVSVAYGNCLPSGQS